MSGSEQLDQASSNVGQLSQERLKEVLTYDAESGWFQHNKSNKVVGSVHSEGYILVTVDGILYYAHRLAWFYVYGEWRNIDHENRIRHDNRLINLRPATRQDNNRNRSAHNSLEIKGVRKHHHKYVARITIDYQEIHLGSFDTIEEAKAAFDAAAKLLHGEFFCE